MPHKRITSDPKIMYGKPVFSGTRITVEVILRLLGQGHDTGEILDAYPGLTKDDIRAAQARAREVAA